MKRAVPVWGPARLVAARDLTADIRLLEIAPERFEPPSPGSHIKVEVQIGGRPDTRSYSLIGTADDGRYRVAVKRLPDSRGGSLYMHGLFPGAQLRVTNPGNHFALSAARPAYALLAGGIGITPLYGMALALQGRGADVRLHYAARSGSDLAFRAELTARLGDRLQVTLDDAGARPDIAAIIAALPPGGELYVCGPIGMLEAAKRAWAESGRPVDGLRFETFGNSGRFASEPFTVRIPRLAKEFTVARNETLLDALEQQGVGMIYDCRRGECGLCAVRILAAEGTVDHRDVFFSDEQKAAGTHLCTCVSRLSGGALTIDTADRV